LRLHFDHAANVELSRYVASDEHITAVTRTIINRTKTLASWLKNGLGTTQATTPNNAARTKNVPQPALNVRGFVPVPFLFFFRFDFFM